MQTLLKAFEFSSFAYLDPGAGSYFFQFLIAGLFGALYAVKTFWAQITARVRQVFSRKK